jgi:hypothetical protein
MGRVLNLVLCVSYSSTTAISPRYYSTVRHRRCGSPWARASRVHTLQGARRGECLLHLRSWCSHLSLVEVPLSCLDSLELGRDTVRLPRCRAFLFARCPGKSPLAFDVQDEQG